MLYHFISSSIISYRIISCTFLPLVLDVFLNLRQLRCTPEASNVHVFNKVSFILVLAKVSTQQVRSPYGISVSCCIMLYHVVSWDMSISCCIIMYHVVSCCIILYHVTALYSSISYQYQYIISVSHKRGVRVGCCLTFSSCS